MTLSALAMTVLQAVPMYLVTVLVQMNLVLSAKVKINTTCNAFYSGFNHSFL